VEAFETSGEVVIRSADGRPVPWQVDGDHVADDDVVRVTVRPGALRVIA
jgi:diacylglycerol kinase family enzyme